MKQKVVIRVSMNDSKSRSKALKIAVGVCGVETAALKGEEKDQIEVTGEDIDAVELTTLLRKGIGFSELVSVGPVEKKEEKPAEPTVYAWPYVYGGSAYQTHYQTYPIPIYQYQEPSCSIM
ncbi:hypothetical protein L6164_028942 [Bauhinia variegata]|uniref:Uncharacterized protein n=1 Tax=Bauhinia variegata TaxID=167791 RepID=A0ACB9L7Q0_BAUVA|nr:hypothetical protein L6164_028942 [Bauhinia variegata]